MNVLLKIFNVGDLVYLDIKYLNGNEKIKLANHIDKTLKVVYFPKIIKMMPIICEVCEVDEYFNEIEYTKIKVNAFYLKEDITSTRNRKINNLDL